MPSSVLVLRFRYWCKRWGQQTPHCCTVTLAAQRSTARLRICPKPKAAYLSYTARDAGLRFYAAPRARQATNQYQQLYPSSADLTGPILLIADNYLDCDAVLKQLDVANTAYENTRVSASLVDTACARSLHTERKDR